MRYEKSLRHIVICKSWLLARRCKSFDSETYHEQMRRCCTFVCECVGRSLGDDKELRHWVNVTQGKLYDTIVAWITDTARGCIWLDKLSERRQCKFCIPYDTSLSVCAKNSDHNPVK